MTTMISAEAAIALEKERQAEGGVPGGVGSGFSPQVYREDDPRLRTYVDG